ncbi:hypothetical protein PybrP1_012590 [[Pythium] brassicae (nom. inval.)]|nr:hypothetical protein PybrP1_012590 [[Pythium] brassicae (nom. inval.)]
MARGISRSPSENSAVTPHRTPSPKRLRDDDDDDARGTPRTAESASSSPSQPEGDSSDSAAKKMFRCAFPGCGREFQLKGNLKRHQNIHDGAKQFRCAFCGKGFLRKADMEVHHRVHTGEKPYTCKFAPECDRSFARRSDLLSHERTHVGTKPFACLYPDCGRHFARKFDLQKHQRMHDNHSSECQKRRKLASPSRDDCECWSGAAPPTDDEPATETSPPASASSSSAGAAAPVTRYQLTCTQDHIHSPPACFAAFTSIDALDDSFFLSPHEAFDLKPFLAPQPGAAVAAAVDTGMKQQFAALGISTAGETQQSMHAIAFPAPLGSGSPMGAARPRSASTSCPIDDALLKDYAKHTPSCGHLSIVHGNHRDYVVKNHLVCQDSVRSISGGDDHAAKPTRCPASEPHRPGCGHLPVRHRDHIDYVVEDNLFCQQDGVLGDVTEHIELLDDDFWDFYGAVGSLNTD